jgi:hypothetical protein
MRRDEEEGEISQILEPGGLIHPSLHLERLRCVCQKLAGRLETLLEETTLEQKVVRLEGLEDTTVLGPGQNQIPVNLAHQPSFPASIVTLMTSGVANSSSSGTRHQGGALAVPRTDLCRD